MYQRDWCSLFSVILQDEKWVSEAYRHVAVPLMIMVTTYWTLGSLFTIVDLRGKPSFITRYRIDDVKKSPSLIRVSLRDVKNVIKQVIFNQLVVAPPVIFLCFYLKYRIGYDDSVDRLPTLIEIVRDFAVFTLVEEPLFYYSHRLLHHQIMYKRFHKQHHEWISPIGISAIYCHPVEHVLSNVLPAFVGPVVAGSNAVTFWMWTAMTTAYGVTVHSGYHLPLIASPEAHDFHHKKFNEMYGIMGFFDRFHGTDKAFRKSKEFRYHRILLSLNPSKR